MAEVANWIPLADAYRMVLAVEGNDELTKRLLANALMHGRVKARSKRAFLGNSRNSIEIEFPTDKIYIDDNAEHNFNWLESRAILGKWFQRESRHGLVLNQPRRNLYRIEVERQSLVVEFPEISACKVVSGELMPVRQRGRRPDKRERVKSEMRGLPLEELVALKEEAMAVMFNASRDTCRTAREKILAEFVEK